MLILFTNNGNDDGDDDDDGDSEDDDDDVLETSSNALLELLLLRKRSSEPSAAPKLTLFARCTCLELALALEVGGAGGDGCCADRLAFEGGEYERPKALSCLVHARSPI